VTEFRPSTIRTREKSDGLADDSRWSELFCFLEGVPGAERVDDAHLAYRYGEALYHTGRMGLLASHAQAFETAARRARDVPALLRALNLKGIAAFELGVPDEAREAFEALMELSEAESDDDMLARAALNLGALANLQGNPADALAMYQLALPLFQKLGQTRGLSQTHQSLGMSYRDLEKWAEAEDAYREAMRLGTGFGYAPIVAMAAIGRSEVQVLRGDPHAALSLVEWGLQLSRQLGDPISEGTALRVRGTARAATDRSPVLRARGDLQQALALARSTDNLLLEAETLRDLARTADLITDTESARQHYEDAAKAFDRLGARHSVREMQDRIAALGAGPPAGRVGPIPAVPPPVPLVALRSTPHHNCSVALQHCRPGARPGPDLERIICQAFTGLQPALRCAVLPLR
jgi:tetratricopeptide (TPR) repeat protein